MEVRRGLRLQRGRLVHEHTVGSPTRAVGGFVNEKSLVDLIWRSQAHMYNEHAPSLAKTYALVNEPRGSSYSNVAERAVAMIESAPRTH